MDVQEDPSNFVLRDGADGAIIHINDSTRFGLGMVNATHQEFILTQVQESDAGWMIMCSMLESFSLPATFRVPCKS